MLLDPYHRALAFGFKVYSSNLTSKPLLGQPIRQHSSYAKTEFQKMEQKQGFFTKISRKFSSTLKNSGKGTGNIITDWSAKVFEKIKRLIGSDK